MGHCHFKKSIISISILCLFSGGYFSPGNCQVNDYDKAVASLNDKIGVLENLIKEAESLGIDVSYQKVGLAVGKIFVGFIPKDAKLTIDDFPTSWVDYRILGKEELVRRMKELPGFEANETEKILSKAINDINEIIKDPSKQIRVPSYRVGKVSTKNGVFQVDGKPIFISGIYSTNFVFRQT